MQTQYSSKDNSGREKVNKVEAYNSRARMVLNLLGFSSYMAFSKVSGVSHMTVSDSLYRTKRRHICMQISTFSKIYETLVSAYKEREATYSKIDKAYIKHWIKSWAEKTMDCDVQIIRSGKRKSRVVKQIMDRERKVARRRSKYALIIKEFCG